MHIHPLKLSPIEDAYRSLPTEGMPVLHSRVGIAAAGGSPGQPGEVGELLAKGPTVRREYLQHPETTSQAFHDGWFRTSGARFLDPECVLRIVDRIIEIIVRQSLRAFTRPVALRDKYNPENTISANPNIPPRSHADPRRPHRAPRPADRR